jgi:hypothetical protein
MHTRLNAQIRKVLLGFMLGVIVSFHCSGASGSPVFRSELIATTKPNKYYTVNTLRLSDGTVIEENIINGPPVPPPGFEVERQAVSLPEPDRAAGTNTLIVPAFNWVFGCSAVSGAMVAGYYDRSGFSNMYTGPTNGGVMPLDNSSWGTWSDGHDTYPNCPLIASHNGVDGRATKGSIDDYWVQYGSSAQDPYITGSWSQHTWGDAIGDYMKTSQSAFGNTDGSTSFYNWTSSASQLTCAQMEGYGINTLDGTYGRKLFYEARGYTVTDCYSQKTDNTITGGFSFAQFKAEIDAGRPVMLNLEGHTIVGVGYDDTSNTVIIHDTWDYNNHTFTWGPGASYAGMGLLSVSIVNIFGDFTPPTVTATTPTNGATEVVVTDPITATFSEAMNAATINSTNFLLDKGVTGPVSYNASTYTATLTPSPSLATNTFYTAKVTINVTDEAGNHLALEKKWTFTTASLRSVRVVGGGDYDSFQPAYVAAGAICTIQSKAVELPTQDFTLDDGKTVTLEGGYNSTYTVNNGYTTMKGKLTLATGSLTVENLIISQ